MKNDNQQFRFLPLLISLLITLSIGAVASIVTIPQITTWYIYLRKPSFNPPNWLFGPVWTLLYVMIAVAAYRVWQQRQQAASYRFAAGIYIVQLLLNFSWSIVFFGLHAMLDAFVIIVMLWMCIVINAKTFYKIDKTAGWLLLPYLIWVTFAAVLNFSVYLLKGRPA